jgi:hypothetical protein
MSWLTPDGLAAELHRKVETTSRRVIGRDDGGLACAIPMQPPGTGQLNGTTVETNHPSARDGTSRPVQACPHRRSGKQLGSCSYPRATEPRQQAVHSVGAVQRSNNLSVGYRDTCRPPGLAPISVDSRLPPTVEYIQCVASPLEALIIALVGTDDSGPWVQEHRNLHWSAWTPLARRR